jgi:hypothetical protein
LVLELRGLAIQFIFPTHISCELNNQAPGLEIKEFGRRGTFISGIDLGFYLDAKPTGKPLFLGRLCGGIWVIFGRSSEKYHFLEGLEYRDG